MICIIADDLTGACDCGVQLVTKGYRARVLVSALSADSLSAACQAADAVAVNTSSRELDWPGARARLKALQPALEAAPGGLIYKKVDSMMRGHVVSELALLMDMLRLRCCILAPAYPENHRVFVGGAARDTQNAVEHAPSLKLAGEGPVIKTIPLSQVRRGSDYLTRMARDAAGEHPCILTMESGSAADLDIIAQAVTRLQPCCLPAGSAGLFKRLVPCRPRPDTGPAGASAAPRPGGTTLIVAGSPHRATRAQVRHIAQLKDFAVFELSGAAPQESARDLVRLIRDRQAALPGNIVLTAAGSPPAAGGAFSREAAARMEVSLAETAARLFGPLRPAALILTGGQTAQAVLDRLGVHVLDLCGQPLEGIAAGLGGSLLVITKSGGFGQVDTLERLAAYAASQHGQAPGTPP